MLHQDSLRTDFEAILLVHGDVEQAHGELSVKYPKQIMPSLNALQVYYDYFWNLGSMGPGELYAFIEQRENNHFHAPAVRGEIVRTYSQLGLQQRITHEKLLQEIVEFGYAAAQKGRRQIDQLGAQMISSLATTALAGAKASEMLQETRLASEGDVSMRQEATDFLAKRIKQPFIPSIDVLDDGVIDVEFEDVDRS